MTVTSCFEHLFLSGRTGGLLAAESTCTDSGPRATIPLHRLADCATELEAARAFLYSVVWRIQAGDYPVAEISMVKKFVAQAQNRIADACLQIHGGAGYMHEYPVSRQFRDARLQRIGAGTDEVMNEVIAKRLGLGAPRG